MSVSKFETVSMLVDNYQQSDAVFDDMIKDNELSDTWERYHLIGDLIRGETPKVLDFDLSDTIANAIADEPTVLAPRMTTSMTTSIKNSIKATIVQFIKPVGQMAIAASAAGLMILGVQQNIAQNETIVPTQVVQTIPFGGSADPVSYNFHEPERVSQKQAYVEQQRRFQALLSDHQQQIKFNSNVIDDDMSKEEKAEETPK